MKIHTGLFTVAIGLVGLCIAAPSSHSHVLHEKRETTSTEWENLGRVEPDSQIVVRVGLRQSGLHKAHEYLMDV